MLQWVYETPWWLPTMVCALGLYLFWTGNNRAEKGVRNAGIAVFLAGLLLGGLSWMLESPRERVQRHTKEIIQAVVDRNWNVVQTLLDPKVSTRALKGREAVLAGLQGGQQVANVTSARILSWETAESPQNISITFDVVSVQDATGGQPFTTGWRFDWGPAGDDWKLVQAEALGAAGGRISGEQIEARIPGAR